MFRIRKGKPSERMRCKAIGPEFVKTIWIQNGCLVAENENNFILSFLFLSNSSVIMLVA